MAKSTPKITARPIARVVNKSESLAKPEKKKSLKLSIPQGLFVAFKIYSTEVILFCVSPRQDDAISIINESIRLDPEPHYYEILHTGDYPSPVYVVSICILAGRTIELMRRELTHRSIFTSAFQLHETVLRELCYSGLQSEQTEQNHGSPLSESEINTLVSREVILLTYSFLCTGLDGTRSVIETLEWNFTKQL